MGISERTAQERLQIARGVPEEVRDRIRGTPIAEQRHSLLSLARVEELVDQKGIVELILAGKTKSVEDALYKVNRTLTQCTACYKPIKRDARHCQGCNAHRQRTEEACGECQGRLCALATTARRAATLGGPRGRGTRAQCLRERYRPRALA